MTNYSSYPSQIDGYNTLPLRKDGVHEIKAADVNRLRDAIVKIEQELGTDPSGSFGTVASRLASVGDADVLIEAHLIDAVDAHDASAISLLDIGDNYTSETVEGAVSELAAALPVDPNAIGNNNADIPNSGIPNFVGGLGSRFVFNAAGANVLKKTQPVDITGIYIIEIGDSNGNGAGELQMSTVGNIKWKAPGDSFGAEVDVSTLSAGDVVTVSSNTTTKRIRVARTSASLPLSGLLPLTDTFSVLRLEADTGSFSITSVGITASDYITRAATGSTAASVDQFVIGGIVYPANQGTLVLQRKRRGDAAFAPIAVLGLTSEFDETKSLTGQPVYTPALASYDTITLYDRLPARKDYETLSSDADGNQVYSNFDIAATFVGQQIAKYSIPVSNPDLVGGELVAPADITLVEMNNKVSAYRVVHYKTGVIDFSGEPAAADIFSLSDPLGAVNDGDNNVRFSNVYLDSNITRPTINPVSPTKLRPNVLAAEVIPKFVSGINYYNSASDKFDLEFKAENVFRNAYLNENILTLTSDSLYFPSGSGYGNNMDVEQLFDDAYGLFSDSNLPTFTDDAFYLINDTVNEPRKLYPAEDSFSTNAGVFAAIHDPFGPSNTYDAYGWVSDLIHPVRILVNSFYPYRATNLREYFTDENRRIGTSELFDFNTEREQYNHNYVNSDGYSLAVWDNTQALSVGTAGGSDGELQCGGRFVADVETPGLIFPQSDYSSAMAPTQNNLPDYSSSSYYTTATELIYQRLFNLGRSTNGARLRVVSGGASLVSFNDIYYGNSSRPIKISVKIPGVGTNSSNWMDLGKLFESGKYGDDGAHDGALFGSVVGTTGDFTVNFTFGPRNTADSEGMIAVRVSYFASEHIAAKTKIITMLELLE